MAMFINNICVTFGFALVVLMQCSAAQTTYVVGDSMGWTVPQGGAQAYVNWANAKNFMVGDVLTFGFTTNEHDVLRVPKGSFDGCTSSNATGDTITTGPVNITLDSTGEHFYICTVGRHCQSGQKLAIVVSSGTTKGASPPSTTPKLAPPNTPSSSFNTTPAACAPTPASSPTSSVTPGSAIPPPPTSSSSNVLAGFLVPMLVCFHMFGFLRFAF